MNQQNIITVYGVYLPVSIALTHYVARVLFNSGKVFMLDIFRGREEMASATNHLFKVGFYLLNLGFALLMLKTGELVIDAKETVEVLSLKVGEFSIYLGIMLFFNLYLFFRGKRKAREAQLERELIAREAAARS